ncbi:MAG: peptidoglycan editing factor PgeF [Haliscomenobacteraceae bacterium CHB4]|nr:Polyphenol oxidase [Saprospiraceae bacterium]MCE7924206.1 peptidoglycan editing factor PgeF [Haliscomenobacteraceae bacterium CHB4]
MYRQPSIFRRFPRLVAAESTRHGGVSPAPYDSLNLGKNTGDDPANVAENRRRFCAALGFSTEQMAWSMQVHADQVLLVTEAGGAEGYDALITGQPGILLAVSVADCTPVLIFDSKNEAVGAVHAGWPGTAARLVEKTLQRMAEAFGTEGRDCYTYVGTCIDECSFEVGEEVAFRFDTAFKWYDATRGKFMVDLKKANTAQLQAFGIPDDQIEISPYSTVLDNVDYFSHRKEKGTTGRMLAVIGLRIAD